MKIAPDIQRNRAKKRKISARIHLDLKLEDRIQFILKEYEYICKDETNILKAMNEIETYSVKKACESWEDLVERSSYKDLGMDLRVFFYFLKFISKQTVKLDGHMFFINPRLILDRHVLQTYVSE